MSFLLTHLDIIRRTALAFFLLLFTAPAFCSTQTDSLPNPLHEGARIFDPQKRLSTEEKMTLEDRRNDFWKRTGLKISILVDSPANTWENLDSFADRIASVWERDGRAGQPGGLLLVVDPQAQRAAVRASRELKPDLPPGAFDLIINDNINPTLSRQGLAAGITTGLEHAAALLERHNKINQSLFIRGYGAVAAIGLFLAGMLLRKRWGALTSGVAAALCFGTVVGFDGFNSGFAWYEVLSFVVLTAPFLGLFVWIGMGYDISADPVKK